MIHNTRYFSRNHWRLASVIHTKEKKVIMKKFIQICSLLSLLVIFGAASANAQSGFGVDVEIPFDFSVGDQSYEAGNYIVKVDSLTNGTATLSIRDTKTDEIQRVLMNGNGDSGVGDIKLVFDNVGGRRVLTKVRTPSRGYALVKSKSDKNAEKARSVASPAVGGSF